MSSVAYPPVIIDPERQIRTASLLPGMPDEEIRCELDVRSLKPLHGQNGDITNPISPEYEALSYTWGSWQETVTIKLSGRPFLVTQNLYRALRRLRRLSSPRCLWVDQLCINQHGNQERNHQVRIMKEVFTAWSTYHRFVAGGQVFFVTARGFLGLGPGGLKEDGAIVLPYGSNAPMALRQEGQNWRFLGFVLVCGIMEDELKTINSDIKFHEQTYVLD